MLSRMTADLEKRVSLLESGKASAEAGKPSAQPVNGVGVASF